VDNDKNRLPPAPTRAGKFIRAAAKHVSGGMKHAPEDVQAKRWQECEPCEQRSGDYCRMCGCQLKSWPSKLAWATESCPLDKWMPHKE